MDSFTFGDWTLYWLDGGITNMDGGAMFGVVPKPLWSRKYPVNELNQIELVTEPLLIRTGERNLLIDSGVGYGKLDDKKKRNYGVTREAALDQSLKELGLTLEDIDTVLMTHMHFDHAGGLTGITDGHLYSVFPNADIYTSEIEWNELRNPNIRSRNTYWKENWEPVQEQVKTFEKEIEILTGIKMIHTGGHSDGHSIVVLEQHGETIVHMADLMPTHAHQNPLWVLAYDDYPMTSVFAKEHWVKKGLAEGWWFSFYHDAIYRMIKWDPSGKEVADSLKRTAFKD
ncbi:MBL fold metallo-hydrolase [Jeotgalibacillus sp. R-1-5s-1]|uniref:YtnP family quorum-quenching lactonase n=1 Tax=Jeotgalibacillus sp. R-1-5s-1 TaxID=2555897 RepID=UPI001068FBBC|nr:MBL fold metallo-hydrolase [Jeotgalibacillus sp. R-1-5s-1]TFD98181.1 MBL fold metallo-hydrolase [Jeotgalibacillus sp. R-1-5s-1]